MELLTNGVETITEVLIVQAYLVRSFESRQLNFSQDYLSTDRDKSVSLKKSKKGDLVFFAFGKSKRKVTHVGILSELKNSSDINFIHASSSRGVVETQLIKDYYLKRLRKVKRVF